MLLGKRIFHGLCVALLLAGGAALAHAQQAAPGAAADNPYLRGREQPGAIQQVEHQEEAAPKVAAIPQVRERSTLADLQPKPGEHPLAPAVRWAKGQVEHVRSIQDYSCTLVKRELVDGKLGEHEYMFIKVRHKPFSVYIRFDGPARVKGQEALFVEGQNDGKMLAHANGMRHRLFGTVALRPEGSLAMSGNRYPITEVGLLNLTERLIDKGENDMQFGECEVKIIEGAKINGREAVCIQVMHPVPRREFTFYLARIYVDNELGVPVRYEAYDWPATPEGAPQLLEEYTYLNLSLNNGFTDADFSTKNPNYQFE